MENVCFDEKQNMPKRNKRPEPTIILKYLCEEFIFQMPWRRSRDENSKTVPKPFRFRKYNTHICIQFYMKRTLHAQCSKRCEQSEQTFTQKSVCSENHFFRA